jgi:hypothetical protein
MPAITTPPCLLHAASLARPVLGFFALSATFDQSSIDIVQRSFRTTLEAEYGIIGRRAMLPLTDLQDGRWLIRFVAKERPCVVDLEGRRLIVEPAVGSILRIETDLRPMRSSVGLMPIMRRVIVVEFVPPAD